MRSFPARRLEKLRYGCTWVVLGGLRDLAHLLARQGARRNGWPLINLGIIGIISSFGGLLIWFSKNWRAFQKGVIFCRKEL